MEFLSPAGTGPAWREVPAGPPNAGGGSRQAVAFKFLNIVFFLNSGQWLNKGFKFNNKDWI